VKIFGLTITRQKAAVGPMTAADWGLSRSGWWPIIREAFTGAWQRNIEISTESVLSFAAVYACVTLIAADIAKVRIKLVRQGDDDIWTEASGSPFSPVLKKPNRYQTRIKFIEQWVTSKLIWGNTYALKERDKRGVVTSLYILDPQRVKVLVAPDGSVWYELQQDYLSGVPEAAATVPASEIIHDVMVALYHPLCGVSPISACGLAAMQGLRVQNHSTIFFQNGANPGGVLTAPGMIGPETAKRLEETWNQNYGGENAGRIAVLGDGLKYERMAMTAVDAQLIDQLKWTAENVCTAFHVPPYMIGVGATPTYNNIEALNQQYYAQCLQTHIESIELLLDEALGLDQQSPLMGTEFDLDALLRMDTATRVKAGADAIGSGGMSPNEARARFFDLPPTPGGEGPYLQQQNWSLEDLSKRSQAGSPLAPQPPSDQVGPSVVPVEDVPSKAGQFLQKALAMAA
jgi:HK97 family phage portal protein